MNEIATESVMLKSVGWIAVVLCVIIGCLWTLWGVGETFHEGWWAKSFLGNLRLSLFYNLPAVLIVVLALSGIRWPKIGGALHIVLGITIVILWLAQHHFVVSWEHLFDIVYIAGVFFVLIGIGYIVGPPQPRWIAYSLVVGMPFLVAVCVAAEPIWRIAHRVDDGVRSARTVEGNHGVELIWAPAGPGWPQEGGVNFEKAQDMASRLNEDGLTLADTPQNIWRLPTIEEVVQSLTRDGKNAGGVWDPTKRRATYRITPDKESPLWAIDSQVVYWWTSTLAPNVDKVFTICYNGRILGRAPQNGPGTIGFRAVKGKIPSKPSAAPKPEEQPNTQ